MTQTLDEFHAEKHSIIDAMFIATADDNYVLARWSFHQHLNVDFFWLAVHLVEKYLKAALLMNGKSAISDRSGRNYSHDIKRLYAAVTPLAPELFPTTLTKPEERMPARYWQDETTEEFIARLYRDGQADNRYQVFGYSRQPVDLWKLDQVVYSIRRVCKRLEACDLGTARGGAVRLSNRQVLGRFPKRWRLNSQLEKTMLGTHGRELRKALLTWNFPFAPKDYKQPRMTYTSSAQNPVLVRRLIDPLKGGPSAFAHNDSLWDWVKTNIQLPTAAVNEIEEKRRDMKERAGA